MKRITTDILISAGACFQQVHDFQRVYPKGCEVCWECFQEARKKHFLPVEWLLHVLYPECTGGDLGARYQFMDAYYRSSLLTGSSYILAEGLQFLEQKLLRCSPPKPNKKRIADYKRWVRIRYKE